MFYLVSVMHDQFQTWKAQNFSSIFVWYSAILLCCPLLAEWEHSGNGDNWIPIETETDFPTTDFAFFEKCHDSS